MWIGVCVCGLVCVLCRYISVVDVCYASTMSCICVCGNVFIESCLYMCVCVCLRACVSAYTHDCACECVHACACVFMRVRACECVHACVCVFMRMCVAFSDISLMAMLSSLHTQTSKTSDISLHYWPIHYSHIR